MSRAPRSRFYDGALYAMVMDRLLVGVHERVAQLVEPEAAVLDAGCGTGALAFRLASQGRRVVGVELSPAMLARAERHRALRALDHVSFVLGDASHVLANRPDGDFDVATMVMALHEMPTSARPAVLRELARLAQRVLCVDFIAPMPRNLAGLRNRAIEMAAGPEHFGGYRSFQRSGGVPAVATEAGLSCRLVRRADQGTLGFFEVTAQA